jgi:hypothetical protein
MARILAPYDSLPVALTLPSDSLAVANTYPQKQDSESWDQFNTRVQLYHDTEELDRQRKRQATKPLPDAVRATFENGRALLVAPETMSRGWENKELEKVPFSLRGVARRKFEEDTRLYGHQVAPALFRELTYKMQAKATAVAVEIGIDAENERIKHFANVYARTCAGHAKTGNTKTVFEAMKTTPALHNEHIITWRNAQAEQQALMGGFYIYTNEAENEGYWLHDAHIIAWHNTTATQRALTYAQNKLGHKIQGDTRDSQLARIQDPSYWRREIRKALRPWRELWHLALAPERLKYASPEAVAEYRSMQLNGEKWAQTHEMTAPDGRTCPLPTPAETAKNRYAQLVAMTKGIETMAGEAGMTAHIATISLDTQWHAAKNAYKNGPRIHNEKYNPALTPRDGQNFLNERWKLYRAALGDSGISTYWVLGVQPNKDQTPHWHLVLWCNDGQKKQAETLLYEYFKTNDAKEKKGDGTVRYVQVDWQEAKSEAGSSSYAMRMLAYITRQTAEQRDNTTADEAEAEAASAWASTWGIRRYRTSQMGATLWKMARNDDVKPEPEQQPIPADLKKSAQDGDFATFYKLKKEYQCRIRYITKTGKYGDTYKSPRGMEYTCAETGEISASWKQTSWTLTGLAEKPQSNQDFYSYFKEPRQGASAPQDSPYTPNTDPPDHWNDAERAEWAEHLAYRQTQQDAKLAKTA